jgi:hypothetical protein
MVRLAWKRLSALFLSSVFLGGCPFIQTNFARPCASDSECSGGQQCELKTGTCVPVDTNAAPVPDAGAAAQDAGPGDSGPSTDGGPPPGDDAGPPQDGGVPDAAMPDAGPVDSGAPEAGPTDGGSVDGGQLDAGPADSGGGDAGVVDADSGIVDRDGGAGPRLPGPNSSFCPRLEITGNTVTLSQATASNFENAVETAASGTTILLEAGDYNIDGRVEIATPNITVRSASGDPRDVNVIADPGASTAFSIEANNVTIAHLTVVSGSSRAIHVNPEPATDNVLNTLIYDVHVADPGEEAILVNFQPPEDGGPGPFYADNGRIACSTFNLTSQSQMTDQCADKRAVEIQGGDGWTLSDNWFMNFKCPSAGGEAPVKLAHSSRGVRIVRNFFRNNHRGILFGSTGDPTLRSYGTGFTCGLPNNFARAHFGGVISNNFFSGTDVGPQGVDYAIALYKSCGAQVHHNTFFMNQGGFRAVLLRFAGTTDVNIRNNLANGGIVVSTTDPAPFPTEVGNIMGGGVQAADHVVDASTGDLHLKPSSTARNNANAVSITERTSDVDGDNVTNAQGEIDVGADEWVEN